MCADSLDQVWGSFLRDRIINLSRRADFRSRAVYVNVWGGGDSLRTQNLWRAAYDGRHVVFGLSSFFNFFYYFTSCLTSI